MEMRLRDGDYVPDGTGSFVSASGIEEIRERVLFKLMSRRGGFALMPDLGSRLYMLGREKPSLRGSAAKQYVLEALSDEPEIVLKNIDLSEHEDELNLRVVFEYAGSEVSVTLPV